ncbi:hypothetical protein [Hydrogenimonas sp.]
MRPENYPAEKTIKLDDAYDHIERIDAAIDAMDAVILASGELYDDPKPAMRLLSGIIFDEIKAFKEMLERGEAENKGTSKGISITC